MSFLKIEVRIGRGLPGPGPLWRQSPSVEQAADSFIFIYAGLMTAVRLVKVLIFLVILANAIYYSPYGPSVVSAGKALRLNIPGCSRFELAKSAFLDPLRQKDSQRRLELGSRLLETDSSGFRLWETPAGNFWVPKRNTDGLNLVHDLAEQERDIYGAGQRAVQPGDIVLDCGANVGVFARKALSAGAKLVVAIEPGPDSVQCLSRNLAAELAASRVVIYPKGVWDREDFLTLNVDPRSSVSDSFVTHYPDGVFREVPRVPLTTIDNLVAELNLERVDFIKMDIEGAEQRAIVGAKSTLNRFRPSLAISAYHLPGDMQKIPEMVRRVVPEYRLQCGPCAGPALTLPGILYFR